MPEKSSEKILSQRSASELHPIVRQGGGLARIKDKDVTDFSNWDLFGLNFNPKVRKAAQVEIERTGVGATGLRAAGGTSLAHTSCERRLAQFLTTECALLFPSRFDVLAAMFGQLFTESDGVVCDEQLPALPSIGSSGALLSRFYSHNLTTLDSELGRMRSQRRRFVIVEHVSGINGHRRNLASIAAIAATHGAGLIVDATHALGIEGLRGAGAGELEGVRERLFGIFGDASFVLAASGGFFAGSIQAISTLSSADQFSLCPSIPPSVAAAIEAALDFLELSHAAREKLLDNVSRLRKGLHQLGFLDALESNTPLVSIAVGSQRKSAELAQVLFERGFLCDTAALQSQFSDVGFVRFIVSVEHSPKMIYDLLQPVSDVYGRLPPE